MINYNKYEVKIVMDGDFNFLKIKNQIIGSGSSSDEHYKIINYYICDIDNNTIDWRNKNYLQIFKCSYQVYDTDGDLIIRKYQKLAMEELFVFIGEHIEDKQRKLKNMKITYNDLFKSEIRLKKLENIINNQD